MNLLLVSVGIRAPEHCVHTWAVPGLTTAGHHVTPFDPYLATELYGWTGCQRLLLQTVRARQIDRVLVFPPYDMLEPATADTCKALGVPIVGFRYDDGIFTAGYRGPRLRHLLSESQTTCHLIGTTCDQAMAAAEALGLTGWERWALPISPEPFPLGHGDKQYDVTFVGPAMVRPDRLSPRAAIVLKLQAAGIDVRVWGHDWHQVLGVKRSNVGPRLSHDEMVRVHQQSRLCLALPGNYHTNPLPMIKFRNLEVALCGSVALQEQHPDVDRQLTPMQDYWPYQSVDDAVVQIRRALADSDRLAVMGRQAAMKVRREFTWAALWSHVEESLAKRGFAPSPWSGLSPDPASRQALAIASLGLAHACEAKGHVAMARGYYEDVLTDSPDDRTAWAGLARLAEGDGAAPPALMAAWEKARGQGPGRSLNMDFGSTLGLPGQGDTFYADPTAEAAIRLFRTKGAAGDLMGAAAEAATFAPHFDTAVRDQARHWAQKGWIPAALRLYDALLSVYPDRDDWRREADDLRGTSER